MYTELFIFHAKNMLFYARDHFFRFIEFTYAAWDCSAWVRTYALFLEERLECFRVLKYDIEAERLVKSQQKTSKVPLASRILSNYFLEPMFQ